MYGEYLGNCRISGDIYTLMIENRWGFHFGHRSTALTQQKLRQGFRRVKDCPCAQCPNRRVPIYAYHQLGASRTKDRHLKG